MSEMKNLLAEIQESLARFEAERANLVRLMNLLIGDDGVEAATAHAQPTAPS